MRAINSNTYNDNLQATSYFGYFGEESFSSPFDVSLL